MDIVKWITGSLIFAAIIYVAMWVVALLLGFAQIIPFYTLNAVDFTSNIVGTLLSFLGVGVLLKYIFGMKQIKRYL